MTRALIFAVVIAGALLGCAPPDGSAGVDIDNDLSQTVRMTYVLNGTRAITGR